MTFPDPRWCARLRARPEAAEDPPPRRVADRADFDPGFDPAAPIVCEICGHEMRYVASCKIACGVCGYRRDCSDP
jgi:hypothetical protein